jgi:transcription initiation factor IIE alpha subunit
MDSLAKNETKQQQEKMVLTEVPENLRRLLLTLVKTFYGLECYIIFNYIQEKVILKEEEIRDICRIDLRQLRKFLVILKVFSKKIIAKNIG